MLSKRFSIVVMNLMPYTFYSELVLSDLRLNCSDIVIIPEFNTLDINKSLIDNLNVFIKVYEENNYELVYLFLKEFNLLDKKDNIVSELLKSEIISVKLFPLFLNRSIYFIDDIVFDNINREIIARRISEIISGNSSIFISKFAFENLVLNGFNINKKTLFL